MANGPFKMKNPILMGGKSAFQKNYSPLKDEVDAFGKKSETKPTPSLREGIKDVRTKTADFVGKVGEGFISAADREAEKGLNNPKPWRGFAKYMGAMIPGLAYGATKVAEGIIRPGVSLFDTTKKM